MNHDTIYTKCLNAKTLLQPLQYADPICQNKDRIVNFTGFLKLDTIYTNCLVEKTLLQPLHFADPICKYNDRFANRYGHLNSVGH